MKFEKLVDSLTDAKIRIGYTAVQKLFACLDCRRRQRGECRLKRDQVRAC